MSKEEGKEGLLARWFSKYWGLGQTLQYRATRHAWNRTPLMRNVRLPNIPWKVKGQKVEHPIAKELNKEFRKNDDMVRELGGKIEENWEEMGKAKAKVDSAVLQLGPYLDAQTLNTEFNLFKNNTKVSLPIFSPTGIQGELRVDPQRIIDTEGNEEWLTVLSEDQAESIKKRIDTIWKYVSDTANGFVGDDSMRNLVSTTHSQTLLAFKNVVINAIDEIKSFEVGYKDKLKDLQTVFSGAEDTRDDIVKMEQSPKYVRYKHTYKIIRPFYIEEKEENGVKKIIVHKFKEEYPNFHIADSEVGPGLDEKGRPLEVYEEGGKWYVLLDKWAYEIQQNKWQIKQINKKISGDMVQREEFLKFMKRASHGPDGREVPHEYVGDLNILDTINYVNNEWDSYRDDYRDGRYHPYSRTVVDYIIAQEQGIVSAKVMDSIPGWNKDPAKRVPVDIEKLPGEEKKITRFSLPRELKTVAIEGEGEEGSKEKKFERKPSHLSPAFDRAAMTKEWIHWGRMYYYDWTDGIKEWSVNPDPMISARGIAKYLINRVIEDTLTVEEANQILERHKYDFGIRRPPGNFTNHPLKGAAGILKYGKYVGKHE